MPSIDAPAASAVITGATNKGLITVASTTPFHVGAEAWVSKDDGSAQQRVIITRLVSSTVLQARPIPEASQKTVWQLSYQAGGDLSAFNAGSRINMPAQVVRVEPSYSKAPDLG